MRSVRTSPFVASTIVALLSLAAPVRAEDEARPKFNPPPWGGADVILGAGSLPEGWSKADDPAAAQMSEIVKGLIAKEQIDDLDTEVSMVSLKDPSGAVVSLLLGDVDVEPKGLPAAVQAIAKEKGWAYRELGGPIRFVLAAGPEAARNAALEAQVRGAQKAVVAKGFQLYRQIAGGQGSEAVFRSLALHAQSSIAIDDKTGAPHALGGLVLSLVAPSRGPEAFKGAVDEYRKAFAEGVASPPEGALAYKALSEFGLALLMAKTPEGNQEAKAVLLRTLLLEDRAEGSDKGVTRYNLACALSLLGEKAEAIQHLEVGLTAQKASQSAAEFKRFLEDHVPQDTDLDNIRNEPAFRELIQKMAAGGG